MRLAIFARGLLDIPFGIEVPAPAAEGADWSIAIAEHGLLEIGLMLPDGFVFFELAGDLGRERLTDAARDAVSLTLVDGEREADVHILVIDRRNGCDDGGAHEAREPTGRETKTMSLDREDSLDVACRGLHQRFRLHLEHGIIRLDEMRLGDDLHSMDIAEMRDVHDVLRHLLVMRSDLPAALGEWRPLFEDRKSVVQSE